MIPFIREFDFVPGRVDTVSPLIRRVIANNPGAFTFTGTGTYIVGRDTPGAEVAVIDPGPMDEAHLEALLGAVAEQRVSTVLVTHTHADHAPLALPFARRVGAKVFAAQPPAEALATVLDEGDVSDFQPDVVLSDGEVLAGDGWTLRTVATPGHASNHLSFWLEEERDLFSGDHVMGWSTTVIAPPDGDMAAYFDSLDKVIELEPAVIWPTHGPAITDPAPFLRAYRSHRLDREAQVMRRLTLGDRRISDIVPALYAAVDARLWPAASLSVWAHLIALETSGRVRADPAPTIDATWSLR